MATVCTVRVSDVPNKYKLKVGIMTFIPAFGTFTWLKTFYFFDITDDKKFDNK